MCKHKLEYCSGCDRVYCSKCEKEWRADIKLPYNGTTLTWPSTYTTVGSYPTDNLN